MAEYVDLTLDSETSDSETSENSDVIFIQKRVKNEVDDFFIGTYIV